VQDHTESSNRLKRYLELDPDNLQLLDELIVQSIHLKDYLSAKQYLDRGITLDDDHSVFLYRSAQLEIIGGEYEQAVVSFRQLIACDELELLARYELARLSLLTDDLDLAKELYLPHVDRITESYPYVAKVTAQIWHHLGELTNAIHSLETHLISFPDDYEAISHCSLLWADREEHQRAKELANVVLESDYSGLNSHLSLGTIALADADLSLAEEYFSKARQVSEGSGRAWVGLGLIHMARQDITAACLLLAKGVQLMPNYIGAWHALAWCCITQKNFEEARSYFNKAIDIDSRFAESYGGLAVILALEGDVDQASKLIRKTLRLNSASFSAPYAQAILAANKGDVTNANSIVEGLLAQDINDDGKSLLASLNELAGRGR